MRTLWIIILMCAVLVFTAAAQQAEGVPATVYQTANVRSGPDTRFEIVGQLAQGDAVLVTGQDASGRWLQVVLESGEIGWLPLFVLTLEGDLEDVPLVDAEPNGDSEDQTVTVAAYGRVNVRSFPAISGDVVGQLDIGDQAQASARNNANNDWLLVENESVEGWVAFFTVRVEGNLDALPVLVPDSSGEALIPPAILLRTRFNARLHVTASLASPTVIVVPFDSEVTPVARSADGNWLLVGYEGQTGWGSVDLFNVSSDDLETIPVFVPQAAPTATAPEATSEVEAE
jgi:uncharacterized protein YgiM (DUF1202 family)